MCAELGAEEITRGTACRAPTLVGSHTLMNGNVRHSLFQNKRIFHRLYIRIAVGEENEAEFLMFGDGK